VTALLTILICKKYSIDMQTYKCRVSDEAADMPGTSAELETGDVLAVADLLYGLLLPSGNDAAVCLAEGMGRLIQKNRKKPSTAPPARTFIRHMNILYKEMMEQQVPQDE
jgi:D-alanyl-D-alanine carboxypeptidase (penicillin-binding protein 5/6)